MRKRNLTLMIVKRDALSSSRAPPRPRPGPAGEAENARRPARGAARRDAEARNAGTVVGGLGTNSRDSPGPSDAAKKRAVSALSNGSLSTHERLSLALVHLTHSSSPAASADPLPSF